MSCRERDRMARAAAEVVRDAWNRPADTAIVLGSGLGTNIDAVRVEAQLEYEQLPGFPPPTALGHRGRLTCGTWDGVPVVVMEGRFHGYEGHTRKTTTHPVRMLHQLGVSILIVTSASGGLNPNYQTGDVVAITDCLDLMFQRPVVVEGADHSCRPGRPGFGAASDPQLLGRAIQAGRELSLPVHQGVYVAMTGPNYETRAEYHFLRSIGGDVVGMSTAPEMSEGVRLGMQVLGLSVVTNCCQPSSLTPTDARTVVEAARGAARRLGRLISAVLNPHGPRPVGASSGSDGASIR